MELGEMACPSRPILNIAVVDEKLSPWECTGIKPKSWNHAELLNKIGARGYDISLLCKLLPNLPSNVLFWKEFGELHIKHQRPLIYITDTVKHLLNAGVWIYQSAQLDFLNINCMPYQQYLECSQVSKMMQLFITYRTLWFILPLHVFKCLFHP